MAQPNPPTGGEQPDNDLLDMNMRADADVRWRNPDAFSHDTATEPTGEFNHHA
jgi:hypothetical protein